MVKTGTSLAKWMNVKENKSQYINTKNKIQCISIGHKYTLEYIIQKIIFIQNIPKC